MSFYSTIIEKINVFTVSNILGLLIVLANDRL